MKTTTEKPASNFELNVMKLGVHTLQLEKGDRFESNGSYFHYVPHKDSPNRGKGKYSRYSGRSNNISAVKYKKDVMRADNIEMVRDEYQYTDSQGKEHRMQAWEVKYAYKVEIPKNENLIYLSIELGGKYSDDESKKQWVYTTKELEVKRVTAENYFLVGSHPATYHSQIPKSDLNNVRVHYGNYYVLCLMDDFHEQEAALFKYVEEATKDKIQTGHDIVRRETDNLNKFLLLKSKHAY